MVVSGGDGGLVLLPDSRALRRVLNNGADPGQVLQGSPGLRVPTRAAAASTARDAIARWDAE
jgi:hypothetical protein